MKAVNIVISFVVFSIVLSVMFSAAYKIMDNTGVEGAETFNQLAGDYESFADEFGDKDSTTREIEEQLGTGTADSDAADINIITGAIGGGRLVLNFIGNFDNVIHNATGDIGTESGEPLIDPRVRDGIILILSIIFIFIVLHFIRGFKTET